MSGKTLCVDFDGTVVVHEYPDVGRDVPYAVEVLKRLEANGTRLILWTIRSGAELQDAVDWFGRKGLTLFGINNNPEQSEWTESPKAYAQGYVDDAAIGCPLKPSPVAGTRPVVDWEAVEKLLQEGNYL